MIAIALPLALMGVRFCVPRRPLFVVLEEFDDLGALLVIGYSAERHGGAGRIRTRIPQEIVQAVPAVQVPPNFRSAGE